ncbi:hypothetical protein A3D68_01330 [Candidatus Adlerbacteria bacterium RIFCSPHIGHO2_02_FULL_52_17]|uniref:Uncharacterized protein n=1 Tax=Candidatus Adlerbacteria bacterium RIFCSPHIGHO2_02_FULL_52_17 TaxID=1797240 RepID=A0A1F4XMZ8_9BACT|nr:MAG: hypothetical protein A3D68_01330 [Candidatus Adlerbacteria bacterium RIFCSPHIGHO2_02_FULL_52_17]
MDIEKLTKHQIILLTLLVSFVTSIATGIVTVSLMDQAPAGVTKVVNQIVEKTIERVVPQNLGAAVTTVTEKTVVVKDDDLIAQSIASVQKGIIRIVAKDGNTLVARGIITSKEGMGLTDRVALSASGATDFEAILASGERVPLTLPSMQSTSTPLATISVAVGTSTGFAPVKLADISKVALGQTVIRIGGVSADTVGSGVVAMIPAGTPGTLPSMIEASVSSATPGSIIITLFGEVVGVITAESAALGSYLYSIPQTAAPATPINTIETKPAPGS